MEGIGIIGLRWFSIMNEWMDCFVLVRLQDQEEAIKAIQAGIDEFWDGQCDCYGDCIEWHLADKNIPYVVEYEDQNVYADDEVWERHLNDYRSIGIEIENVR